jgi:hypothetical protein
MALNKAKEETEEAWGRHREELKSLWLEKRLTVKQVQDYMSQMHNFWKESVGDSSRSLLKPTNT